MINKTAIAAILTLSTLAVFIPSTAVAQHGARRHAGDPALSYDASSETTINGTVEDMTSGRSAWRWLSRIHTLGLTHADAQEKHLVLKTDTDTIHVHLGPATFLTEMKVEVSKGDTLEVTGSRLTIRDSQVVLAREIRKGDTTWTLRSASGHGLWNTTPPEQRRFWTTTKVVLIAVGAKVALLATVLRH